MDFVRTRHFLSLSVLSLLVCFLCWIALFSVAWAQGGDSESPWQVRCQDFEEGVRHCEIFQRLVVQETGMVVADFAIGYPQDSDVARGVIILPLGMILLQEHRPSLQIDEETPFSFGPRFCAPLGCYSYLSLNDFVINALKKGNNITLTYHDLSGRDVKIKMSLQGFTKAIGEIQ